MGQFFDEVPQRLFNFIEHAHIFFVATAPLQGGSVNVSPKATHTGDGKTRLFELVDKNRARYLDLTGSGNETLSHLIQPGNGRLTIMFVNIESGAPNIVRLYGTASVHERGGVDPGRFASMWYGPEKEGQERGIPTGGRAIVDLNIHTCATSCGYSIPVFEFKHPRKVLDDFFVRAEEQGMEAIAKRKGKTMPQGVLLPPSPPDSTADGEVNDGEATAFKPRAPDCALEVYWALENNLSIDGLPGFSSVRGMRDAKQQEELLRKRELHDKLEAPSGALPDSYYSQRRSEGESAGAKVESGAIASKAQGASYSIEHIAVAFTAGCCLTAAIMMATRSC